MVKIGDEKLIWLVDYTNYYKKIDDSLVKLKRDYFRIKSYKRNKIIGKTAPAKSKVFSMGLLRIATILHQNDVEIKYIHWYQMESLLSDLTKFPEMVAFSAVCPTVPMCAELGMKIKMYSPTTLVAIGGAQINVGLNQTKKNISIL